MASKPKYRVLVGMDYPENRRAEAGDVVTDLPDHAINYLLRDGKIEKADKEEGEK